MCSVVDHCVGWGKMSGNEHSFVEWREHYVSKERGKRVVHYFLKDSAGESILAVIGTERSLRHMFYVVAEDFVQEQGNEICSNSNFKWRSRREVVDWLTSFLSKHPLHGALSESPQFDSSQALGTPEHPINAVDDSQIKIPQDPGHLAKSYKINSPDIDWSGVAWTCGKQLKHFPAFCRNGVKIETKSFVFVMAKGENRHVAYTEDMYEDKKGQKKVKVRWFHHNHEVKGVRISPLQNLHAKEVFITPYVQVISAECVDGPATVLTREHYENCLPVFPRALLTKVHICSRQFKNNLVKTFDLRKMQGYFGQPILSHLSPNLLQKSEFASDGVIGEEDKLGPSEYVKLGTKRTRNGRQCQRVPTDQNSNLRFLDRTLLSLKLSDCQPCYSPHFKVDEKVELLCQDSGIRGCWFRCTILQTSRKQIRVRYNDLLDEEGSGNLEEWIPAFRLAMPDKTGMRHLGRPMTRPSPPEEQINRPLEVGTAIDAWWSDGWWEGIITGFGSCGDNLQVYFPGESFILNMDKKHLRISRDWLGDKWVDIESKPDVFSVISSTITPCTRPFVLSNVAKDIDDVDSGVNTSSSFEVPTSSRDLKNEVVQVGASASFDDLSGNMDLVIRKNSSSVNDIGTEGVDANDSCGDIQDVHGNDDSDDKDDNNDNDGSGVQEGMEVFESPGKSPKVVEMMEVVS